MKDHNKTTHGKREAKPQGGFSIQEYWRRYRAWLKGLTRGQLIRYRLLQIATVLGIIIIAGFLWLRAWIRLPEVPNLPGMSGGSQSVSDSEGVDFDGAQLPDVAKSGRKDGYYTFLVAGRDVASGSTDTILLFTFDTKNKVVNALSIPRDTMINTSASSKRINSAYARNRGSSDLPEEERVAKGMAALQQEVSKLTGIYPDFYVFLEWDAVGELVDALDGVYFDVPFDMDYDDPYQDLHIHQKAGYRLLNGDDAMQVVRWRKNNTGSSGGDVARIKVQQAFLSAVLQKCLQPATLLKTPTLAQIFLDNVETDLSIGNLLAFAELAVGIDTENDVSFVTVPYANAWYNGASMVTAVEDELLEILNNGMNPYQDEIKSSDLQLIYKKSDGSYGVTNGTLADPKMGRVSSSSSGSSSQTEEDEGETPILPDDETAQNPDGSQGSGTTQSPDGSQGSGTTQNPDGSQGSGTTQSPDSALDGETAQNPDSSQSGETVQDPAGAQGSGDGQATDATSQDIAQGGGSTGFGQPKESQDSVSIGSIDPDQVLPDPNQTVSQDIRTAGADSLDQAA